jgi:predicted amidohydrolase
MLIAAAQLTSVPGDVEANVAAHVDLVHAAAGRDARLVAFPELSLTGYELARIEAEPALTLTADDPRLDPLKQACAAADVTAVVGLPMPTADGGRQLCALAIRPDGTLVRGAKTFLHGVENDVFTAGDGPTLLTHEDRTLALAVCADASHPEHARAAAAAGAEVYVCGAIFSRGTEQRREDQAEGRSSETGMALVFALTTGKAGPYDTDGGSGVWDSHGRPLARLGAEGPALVVGEV